MDWIASCLVTPSENIKIAEFDTDKLQEIKCAFDKLSPEEKSKLRTYHKMYERQYGSLTPEQKTFFYYKEEIDKRITLQPTVNMLPLDFYSLENSILDLLKSLENTKRIQKIYSQKKLAFQGQSPFKATESEMLIDCMNQGRNLFLAGKNADLLSKPLIYFYSFMSYTYAGIVLNSPMHKALASMKNSHGQAYDKNSNAIEFGGAAPWGTFCDLIFSYPTASINGKSFVIHYSLLKSLQFFQKNKIKLSLMTLLSMVPELSSYHILFKTTKSLTFSTAVETEVVAGVCNYKFTIGDGERRPIKEHIENDFPDCDISEKHGCWVIFVTPEKLNCIMPTLYVDSFGMISYIEKPGDTNDFVMPEICLHYLIMASFSCIMRYTPYEWKKLLSNNYSSEITLLIGKYIRIFEQKYPIMLLRLLSDTFPVIFAKTPQSQTDIII